MSQETVQELAKRIASVSSAEWICLYGSACTQDDAVGQQVFSGLASAALECEASDRTPLNSEWVQPIQTNSSNQINQS